MSVVSVVMIVALFAAIGALVGGIVGAHAGHKRIEPVLTGIALIQSDIKKLNDRIDREWNISGRGESL